MATSQGPTTKLCNWVCSTSYEDLPAEVRKESVTLLYDTVGAMIPSATLPSCQPVVDLIKALGDSGGCSIIGHPLKTSIISAALANGTIGHGDEMDATSGGSGRFAATIVPTVLTVGQYTEASGKELVRALALGSELAARIQGILNHYGTRSQFAPPAIGGTMGAAASAGLLLGLDSEEMEHTLGLAASGACGLSSFHKGELHQIKSLMHGKAAEAGVLSALLAHRGFHGTKDILTLEDGFFDAFLGIPVAGHEVVDKLGENYLMAQNTYKRYPVVGANQAALHALLQVMKRHELTADDIVQIEVIVTRNAFQTVANRHPAVHMETILSMASVYGEITFKHIYDPSYREDSRFTAFRERVRIIIIPRPDAAGTEARLQSGVTVNTRNGEAFREDVRLPALSEEEIQQKFWDLAGLRLDNDKISDLETKLKAVETMENVAPLVAELELDY